MIGQFPRAGLGPKCNGLPIEVVQIGGLPAARLVNGLVAACWSRTRSPLCWKGRRICHLPKNGGQQLECIGQRGIMISDQASTVHGRLLRPKLIEPNLAPSSQAVGSARRGAMLTTHYSWALFSAAID